MNKLSICMKSGDKHIIFTEYNSITDFISSMSPRNTEQNRWNVLELVEEDYLGNNNIMINGSEIEAVKYFNPKI